MMTDDTTYPRTLFICGGSVVFGFERVILRYIDGLQRLGFPLHCTISGWNDGTFPSEVKAIGVSYEEIKLGWLYWSKPSWTADTLRNMPSAMLSFRRVLRRFQPHVTVHSGYRSLASLGWLIGNDNVVAVQDYWTKSWEHRLVRRLDRYVRAYIACSDDVAGHLRTIGLPAAKIVRIYNPMSFAARRTETKHREGPVVFGITGQIIERKGHHTVIEAMARIRSQQPAARFRLKIFGNGDAKYISQLNELASSRGVAELIDWCGYRTNTDEYYPQLDCALVMTTNRDPCPLAAIEPGAYSLPAITSTAGGLAELVIDGKTGFLVQANDVEVLADRMLKIILDEASRRQMGQRAFYENKRRFDEVQVIDQVATVLTNAARSAAPLNRDQHHPEAIC